MCIRDSNGSGFYPATGGTLALDTTLTRPITGGSGAFAGASGWAVTQHFTDDTWKHTFHLIRPPGDDHDGERKRRGRRSKGRGR